MNEYLSAMTDIIEKHGGFVDKYIGDAIVAVFGAPLDDPDHATSAVRAALAMRRHAPRAGNASARRSARPSSSASASTPARRWSATSARGGASTTR